MLLMGGGERKSVFDLKHRLTFVFSLLFLLVGFKIDALQRQAVEIKRTYDDYHVDDPECGINETFNANRICNLTFVVPEDLEPPILVYYELTNFHQNHRTYLKSFDPYQLYGQTGPRDPVSERYCEPLNKLGGITLNPCGLIANTFFNDYFTLLQGNSANGLPLTLIEDGIAWQSDIELMYNQPNGFRYEECPAGQCDSSCCNGAEWSCSQPYVDKQGNCYRYFYPDDDTTQYLYETYPDIISPLEGVTNEHFIVWMKVATQPNFRKLYGWFDVPIAKGEELVFQVNANYVVTRFQGSKSLIVAKTNTLGGKNPYLGMSLIGAGGFILVMGILFGIKQCVRPRKLADPKFLHYKED
jgi:hypothetical protein